MAVAKYMMKTIIIVDVEKILLLIIVIFIINLFLYLIGVVLYSFL